MAQARAMAAQARATAAQATAMAAQARATATRADDSGPCQGDGGLEKGQRRLTESPPCPCDSLRDGASLKQRWDRPPGDVNASREIPEAACHH